MHACQLYFAPACPLLFMAMTDQQLTHQAPSPHPVAGSIDNGKFRYMAGHYLPCKEGQNELHTFARLDMPIPGREAVMQRECFCRGNAPNQL